VIRRAGRDDHDHRSDSLSRLRQGFPPELQDQLVHRGRLDEKRVVAVRRVRSGAGFHRLPGVKDVIDIVTHRAAVVASEIDEQLRRAAARWPWASCRLWRAVGSGPSQQIHRKERAEKTEVEQPCGDRNQADRGNHKTPRRLQRVEREPDDDDSGDDPNNTAGNAEHEIHKTHRYLLPGR